MFAPVEVGRGGAVVFAGGAWARVVVGETGFGAAAVLMGRGELSEGGSLLRRKSTRDSSWGRWFLRGSAVMKSASSSSSESEGMA